MKDKVIIQSLVNDWGDIHVLDDETTKCESCGHNSNNHDPENCTFWLLVEQTLEYARGYGYSHD